MEISDDTRNVVAAMEEHSKGGLRKRNDIEVLLELAVSNNEVDLIMRVTRSGVALWKVYGTLRRLQPGAEGYALLEREFALQMNDLRTHLGQIMGHADDVTLKRFDDIYFGMTQGVILNLVDLGHDLSALKAIQTVT